MNEIEFRTANQKDCDFVVQAIIESEKSGTETLSWSRILQISEAEVAQMIRDVLEEEIGGQEWCLDQFTVAEKHGTPVAALSAWIEGESGIASGILKAQTIAFLRPELWMAAADNLKSISELQIPRQKGALQLENIYTHPDFRGQGIVRELINYSVSHFKDKHRELGSAEIQLMANNSNALHAYESCGFLKVAESSVCDNSILNLLPGRQRVSLKLELQHGKPADTI